MILTMIMMILTMVMMILTLIIIITFLCVLLGRGGRPNYHATESARDDCKGKQPDYHIVMTILMIMTIMTILMIMTIMTIITIIMINIWIVREINAR